MPSLTNPETAAAMRADPVPPVKRVEEKERETAPNTKRLCIRWWTPPALSSPDPPIAPRPVRRPGGRGAKKSVGPAQKPADKKAQDAYHAQKAAYELAFKEYKAVAKAAEENQDEPTDPNLLFTHGKSSLITAPAMVAFAEGYARTQSVLAFEDQGVHNQRASTFRSLLNTFPSVTTLCGRSYGACAAARAQLYGPAKQLILFAYPLHSGLQVRSEELLAIEADVDVLLIAGTEDEKMQEIALKDMRSRMRCKTWWIKVVRGDHALLYNQLVPEKRIKICNIVGQLAAEWAVERDPTLTQLTLDWEGTDEDGQPKWTDWTAPVPDPPRPVTTVNVSLLGSHLPGGGGGFSFGLN